MDFGIRLPTSNRVASRQAISDVASAAEEFGFHSVTVHDHLIFNGWWVACGAEDAVGDGDDRDMYEALVTLAYVAGQTESVRLMTGILLLPIREAILAAKQLATLDVLSNGRVTLGVGIGSASHQQADAPKDAADGAKLGGHYANAIKESKTFNVPKGRGRYVDEQIKVMRAVWTMEESTFHGEFIDFEDIDVFPKPLQEGGPPILIGGNSVPARRRAAALGDGWLPTSLAVDRLRMHIGEFQGFWKELGRSGSPVQALNGFAMVDRSPAVARDVAKALESRFGADELAARNIVGTPDEVIPLLRDYKAIGVDLFELKPLYRSIDDLIAMMELLSTEVFPAVNS